MSLSTGIAALATRVATEFNSIRTELSDKADADAVAGLGVVIATDTSPANGGTYTIVANTPTTGGPATTRRVATSVAGFTLAVPTSGYDGQQIIVEITPTVTFSLIVHASIIQTTGLATPIAVAANKTLFLALRLKGSTWYVMAARVSL